MPLKNQLHIDQLLSQVSVKYQNSEYIAPRAFPILSVKKDTDLYRVYERNLRIPETNRAPGGLAREAGFNVSTASYALKWNALKAYVPDSDADNYDMADLMADTAEDLTDQIQRKMESDFVSLFTKTSWSLTHSLASGLEWTAATTTANPIADMDTAASVVIKNSGYAPNFAILGRDGMIAAKNNINVLDRIKYTSAEISESMLAALFGVGELIVSSASKDANAEGLAASVSQLWPDHAFLGYKPPRPSPKAPSCGYIFEKARAPVKRWREEEREATAIEVNKQYDIKIVASLSGYLVTNVV